MHVVAKGHQVNPPAHIGPAWRRANYRAGEADVVTACLATWLRPTSSGEQRLSCTEFWNMNGETGVGWSSYLNGSIHTLQEIAATIRSWRWGWACSSSCFKAWAQLVSSPRQGLWSSSAHSPQRVPGFLSSPGNPKARGSGKEAATSHCTLPRRPLGVWQSGTSNHCMQSLKVIALCTCYYNPIVLLKVEGASYHSTNSQEKQHIY